MQSVHHMLSKSVRREAAVSLFFKTAHPRPSDTSVQYNEPYCLLLVLAYLCI